MSTTAQTISKTINPSINTVSGVAAIKTKMKATWMTGDYDTFSRYMEEGAKEILAGWDIKAGNNVLDVGCGSGQTAIPAAQIGANVSGIDIATNLIESARERAALEGVTVRFDEGDAEQIPYDDNTFDTVISMIGAMFAPRPDKVVSEFARVCRSGGTLRMANWTPQSMPGQMFKIVGSYVTPPAGVVPPVLWGDEETVHKRLSDNFSNIKLTRKYYPKWFYPFSATELVNYFREHFGPVKRAFATLNEQGQQSLFSALEQNFENHNIATDGTVEMKGEYLDVYAVRT